MWHGEDLELAGEMVARHQGSEAFQWFEYWAERQPEQVFVCRGSGPEPLGMLQYVLLSQEWQDAANTDPCTRAVLKWAARHAPLRPGERILLTRFWMGADAHQEVGPVPSCLWIHASIRYRLLKRLALGVVAIQRPEFWTEAFRYMDFKRAEGADFEVGGVAHGIFVHDWRVLPVGEWNRLSGVR